MTEQFQGFSRVSVAAGLGLSLLVFGLLMFSTRFPTPVPASAPPDRFSAARAEQVLQALLLEGVPHPMGSAENRQVKERIVARLEDLGLAVEEQSAVGCHARFPLCGFVDNVMAVIPGQEPGPAILLMSHYDSVPAAPGAGDDGAGVAAMLEVARALTAQAPLRLPVMLLFTDGEEFGLLGAEAFFGQHPWAANVGVVLNVEGSGTRGESLLLRTGPDSGWVVDAFTRSVRHPSAYSIADEVFNRMPNDTDFSVSQRMGIPGLDFAFAGERTHYHTPLDTVENLSLVTLQHHGENLLPLTRELASGTLAGQAPGNRLFLSFGQVLLITWDQRTNLVLAIAATLLLAIGCIVLVRGGQTTVRRLVLGFLTALAIMVSVVLLNMGVFKLLAAWNGTVAPWPAHQWPFRLCMAASTLAAFLLAGWALARFLDFWSSLLGAWLLWLALAIAAVVLVPVAANTFLIPVLGAGLLIVALAPWQMLARRREILASLTLALATLTMLPGAWNLEQTQGYRLIIAVFPFLAIHATALLPLLRSICMRPGRLLLASATVLVIGFGFAVTLPLYSEWRPQHINILHVEDADEGVAHWLIEGRTPLPEGLAALQVFEQNETPVIPWSESNSGPVAQAPASGAAGPTATVLEDSISEDGRRLRLRVRSRRGASHIRLVVPDAAGLQAASMAGQAFALPEGDRPWRSLLVEAVPDAGVELEIELTGKEQFSWYLYDWDNDLPPAARSLIEARAPLAVPVRSGDRVLVFSRFTP